MPGKKAGLSLASDNRRSGSGGRTEKGTGARKGRKSPWPTLLFSLLVIGCIAGGSLLGVVLGTMRNTPKLEDLAYRPSVTTTVYDIEGETVAKLHAGENRTLVPISKIPQSVQDAVVAVEDDKFYTHHGINPIGIIRAIIVNLREGRSAQGGSTITQQLIKNAFFTPEKLFTRKIKEAILAIQLERTYTKEEILELYLNQIYFGHGAYGVEAAAQTYFGKPVTDLTLAESALIAGVTKGPRYYSPYIVPEAAIKRRSIVLRRMLETGFITEGEFDKADAEPIKTAGLKTASSSAPYFIDYIRDELIDKFGVDEVYKGGLAVYTTLDLDMQHAAEKALIENLPDGYVDDKGLKQPQGSLICIDPQTGYIKAMVGGRGDDKYNRSTQALRQPGSSFKPFVYATALDNGYSPQTQVVDEPITYPVENGKTWSPLNYDRKYRGTITLRKAIEDSVNTVAVKVADQVGVRRVIDLAQELGISSLMRSGSKNDVNLSTALGGLTRGVTPLELTVAYSAFANKGYKVTPIAILRVEDRYGNLLHRSRVDRVSVLSETTAFLIADMMRGVIERGTGRSADIGRPAAGKTGTTSDNTNAWFVGFTPDLATAVWIGNDEQVRPIRERGISIGSARAAKIWGLYMREALRNVPVTNFQVPAAVQPDLTTPPPMAESEGMLNVEEPTTEVQAVNDDVEEVLVCVESEQLATESCPQESVVTRLYDVATAMEVDAQGTAVEGTQRPVEGCTLHPGPLLTQ